MSKIIVPLHFAKLNSTPANVETGFKKFYLRGEWFKLYNGITEIDVVLDRPLDNYLPIPGIITASDTVLTAIEKLDYTLSNINTTTVWGSIIGNILAQTDLIAYIASVTPPASPLSALPFTTDHLAATNNQYVVGDLVWYLGNVYRCLASNDSIIPTSTLYWTNLGAGFPLVQQPADWNSTSGNNQILNKPTIPTTPSLQQVTTVGNTTTLDVYANSFYTNTGYALMDDGTVIGETFQFPSTLSYLDYNGAGFNVWQLPNQTGTIALTSDIGTWGAKNYPTWSSGTPFVKMTAAGTFALDTNTYVTTANATLQNAYNNSTDGKILLDLTRGAVKVQAITGTVNTIESNAVAGNLVFYVDNVGNVVGQYIYASWFNTDFGKGLQDNSGTVKFVSAYDGIAGQGRWESNQRINYLADYSALYSNRSLIDKGYADTTYVPKTRTLTINGTSYDLSADRTWTIATGVTSVTATSPITSSGGTTPVISTSMATNKLIGRSTAGTGVMEEITVGTGLSLSGGTLNATAQTVGFEQNFLLMGS
jgi:hypothetical protein